MQMPRNFDHKFLFVISFCSMAFGILFGFFLFPKFLQHSIKSVSSSSLDQVISSHATCFKLASKVGYFGPLPKKI